MGRGRTFGIGHDDLIGLSWNPATIVRAVAQRPRPRRRQLHRNRLMSPGFDQLIQMISPGAELVDATPILRAARDVKTVDELVLVATARPSPRAH